jgi:DNA-binding MarR family transcriptional regulator
MSNMPRRISDAAVTDFVRAVGVLVRRIRAAGGVQELSLTQTSVLKRLGTEGAATIADLARAESMKPQSMATAVAGLEQLGLVQRTPHPTDGRQVNIEISPKGAALRKSSKDAKQAWIAHALVQLEDRDLETLFAAGEIIQRLVKL